MIRYAFITLILLSISNFSYAQELQKDSFCEIVMDHTPSDDVAYKPGIDVRGNPVVPADLGEAAQYDIPDVVRIPLTIDLAEQLDQDLPDGFEMNGNVGFVDILKDGGVRWNGRDVTNNAQVLCGIDNNNTATRQKDATDPPLMVNENPPAAIDPEVNRLREETRNQDIVIPIRPASSQSPNTQNPTPSDDQVLWGEGY